jgi:hypothetical protein
MSPMSTPLDWILACERQGLLASADVRRFRQLAELTGDDFSARVILKWLTTRDRITTEQADRILSGPPDLSPAELIIRVLGDMSDQAGIIELDTPVRESDDFDLEEDTKDLAPLDRESVGELVLPPRGSPAFSGTIVAPKAIATTASAAIAEPEAVGEVSSSGNIAAALDELLAEERSDVKQAAGRKRPTLETSSLKSTSNSVLIAAIGMAVVLLAAVIALWIASR